MAYKRGAGGGYSTPKYQPKKSGGPRRETATPKYEPTNYWQPGRTEVDNGIPAPFQSQSQYAPGASGFEGQGIPSNNKYDGGLVDGINALFGGDVWSRFTYLPKNYNVPYGPNSSPPFGWTDREYEINKGFNQNTGIMDSNQELMAKYWDWKQEQRNENGPFSGNMTYDFGDPQGPPKPPGYNFDDEVAKRNGQGYRPYAPSGGGGYTYPSYSPSSAKGFSPRDPKRGWVQKVLNWRISS